MFGVYILFSESSDKFYVGHTQDIQKRLLEHNSILTDSYTAKHRPWVLMIFVPVSEERKYAARLEMAIMAKKSKLFIQNFLKYEDLRQKMVDQILLT